MDKQVFSHLFNAKEEKYSLLREKILSHKDEFIFFYSNAHLFDLQDDKTDIKYTEMEFMQSIVSGYHLIYENHKQEVIKQSPRNAFETIGKIEDFSWLENFDFSQTFTSLMKFVSHYFYENKESYKIMRDNTIARYNPTSIKAEGENVFNEQLASSPLGLSFLDIIQASLTQTGLSYTDFATVYYMSYILLDLFGVNKETRKKVKFRNMQVDCYHSFFGSYCDCMVSDDEGMRLKSKTLYKLFNFNTKVYSIDEFIEKFDEAINNNKKSAREYFDEVLSDYITRQVTRVETKSGQSLTYLSTSYKYFGYFNCMIERKSKDETVIILHKNNDLKQPILAKELEIITNRIVRVFNDMGATFTLFDEAVEIPLLKADNWNRFLTLNDADVCLTRFKDTPMLCLWIKLKQPILQNKN